MSTPTLLRIAEHEALSRVTLSGRVVDLGGDANGAYLAHLRGTFTLTSVNLDESTKPDVIHDLEKPLPLTSGEFDAALLINVLEHVYEYRQLLAEAVRVLTPGGTLVVVVPFLFPVHPDPNDYWRFSGQTLQKEFELLGLSDVRIDPLGSGVFAARYVMLDRVLPAPLRFLSYHSIRHCVALIDATFAMLARTLGKKYLPSDYALGYCITGKKPVRYS